MDDSAPNDTSETDPDDLEAVEERVRSQKRIRLQLTAESRDLVDEVAALLFRADPAGINFGSNTDEYESEAEVIVLGLDGTSGAEDVAELTQRVFSVWFDADIAGPVERYEPVAAEIWDAWLRHRDGSPSPD
jgi:hypothetical protein